MHDPSLEILPARLRRFVERFDDLLRDGPGEPDIVARGGALLEDLVAHDDWLPAAAAQADPAHYRQYLLYRDPAARYAVVAFVWGPGQSTPVHDHTVWGLVGVLRGAETTQGYRFGAAGLVPDGPLLRMAPGAVAAVSPALGDIHRVANACADRVSVSIHVYGADIGAIDRSLYAADGTRTPFRSGYADWVRMPGPGR